MAQGSPTILADARWIGFHGIGRFAREVLNRLPPHAQLTSGPRPLSAADPVWLAYQVMTRRPPVFFSPGFNPPPLCSTPFVFTIHDLIQIQLPDVATPAKHLYYRCIVKPACRRASCVLTVSAYSRGEIVKWSGLPEERVVNVGNGVGVPFCPWGDSYQPGFPYILYVGSFRPHKNVQRLMRAFRDIDYPELRLVIVGPRRPSLTAYLDELGIGSRTVVLGQLTDEELARVYRGALLLAQPSLIEGFGLPALEAMACGTPAVVSRTTALPEVCGSAGVYVDPLDTREIQKALERVLGDGELRARLRNLGIQRARAFSWDRVAATVRALLEGAAAGDRSRWSGTVAAHH